jgi:hypothetical protein
MNDRDHRVIPYEEAVRRHRVIDEQKRMGMNREVKISDAMSHLLEEQDGQDQQGQTPAHLRSIVEREFSAEERSGGRPDDGASDGGGGASRGPDRRPAED